MSARLAPRDAPYPDGMDDTLRRRMGGDDRPPLALFRTIAHHAEILERFRQGGSTLLSFGRPYHLVGFLCGAFRVEREPWAPLPPATPTASRS